MFPEINFTLARSCLSDLFDQAWDRSIPVTIRRHKAEKVLLVRRDLQKNILRAFTFKPEILHEEDGSVTLALNELDIVVNTPTLEEAVWDLVKEMRVYAEDYRDRIQLFLHAPNRQDHYPYIMRIWLSNSDEEIRSLLEV